MRESNLYVCVFTYIHLHTYTYTAKNTEIPQMLNYDSVVHSYASLYFLNVYNYLH